MERACYNCSTELDLEEAVKGQEWLDWVNNYPEGGFEGWVHCEGPEDKFIQESDTELLKECINMPLAHLSSYGGSIIICVACVKTQFQTETGIQFTYEESVV